MARAPIKIYISDEIQNLLVTDKQYNAELFLLGKNENGVFTKFIRLPTDGGCDMSPGVKDADLHRAYLRMEKLGAKSTAFGYRTSHGRGMDYEDVFAHPRIPFICSALGGFSVIQANYHGGRSSENFEVCVVDKYFNPRTGRRVLTRVRRTPLTPKHKETRRGSSKR